MKYVIAFVHYLLQQVAPVPIISARYKLVSLCEINRVSDTGDERRFKKRDGAASKGRSTGNLFKANYNSNGRARLN